MNIQYSEELKSFHLSMNEMSYAFGIGPQGRLLHLYWGPALAGFESLRPSAESVLMLSADPAIQDERKRLKFELPVREPWDYSDPILWGEHADGERGLRLIYKGHCIEKDHLTVFVQDTVYPVEVEIHYRGWGNLPLLSRWLTIQNRGENPVKMTALKSAVWHVPSGWNYRLTHLSGNWGCEYTKNQQMLTQARVVLQNSRVTCAAAQQTPFFALDKEGVATETSGNVYFGVLHWSGDFNITVEQQFGKRVSVTGGINEFDSSYRLKPGESFTTPEFTGGLSNRGFERMSEILYDWQLDYLMPRGDKLDKAHSIRPVIYNSWYPFEFDVREDNCLALIDKCAALGIELFIIDDGWMPKRVNEKAGLGDWVADPDRFPRGLKVISEACHEKGMMFGLWVEPEMANPNSNLYRAHPDWFIHSTTRPMSQTRNQVILNLARDDIRDWTIQWLDKLIRDNHLDYLKWDMNRYIGENSWPDAPIEERQSLSIRYTRNLLAIWKHLNETFPDVLFENCASGGGRSDFGLVPYADRINRSDNADPVDIMVLHEGFSMLFLPKTAGGAGNIAPARHHIHNRLTPLNYRIHWGMTGSMSIGVNLLTSPQEELDALREAIIDFKRRRGGLQDAYVYRIASATEHPYAVFQYVRRDRKAFTLFAFAHGMRCWDLPMPSFPMRGLIAQAIYEDEQGNRMMGDALMNIGISIRLKGDCASFMSAWHIVET